MDRDNPWIALLKVRIRALCGQSMDCTALARWIAQPKQSDLSRERKGNCDLPFGWRSSSDKGDQVLGEFSWISLPIRLPALELRNVLCLPAKKTVWNWKSQAVFY